MRVEPHLRRRARRDPVPGVRSSATGVLLVAALLAGGTVTGFGVVAPAATTCDVGASDARLAKARRLVTALRLGETTDPRRAALARDLRALGITPAVSTGWRQQAVDVSDQLRGTTDPTLHRVAVALARSGVGPTPADLLRDEPGPVEDLLNTANQSGSGVIRAIDAAEQALSRLPATPTASDLPRASGGLAPRPRVELPRACTQAGGAGTGDTSATTDPPVSAEPDSSTEPGPSTLPSPRTTTPGSSPASQSESAGEPPITSASSTPDLSSGSTAPELPDLSITSSRATPTSDSSDTAIPSPDPSDIRPGGPGDLRGAADLVQAVADLLRSLSGQSSPDAQQLAEQLRRLLPQVDVQGAEPSSVVSSESRSPESSAPDSTLPDVTSPDPTSPDMTSSARPSTSDRPSVSIDPSGIDDAGQPGVTTGDWESQAGELADQAHQAAAGDPLARDLASKLDAAGFGDGSGVSTNDDDTAISSSSAPDTSTSGSSTPDSSTPDPSTPDSATPDPRTPDPRTPDSTTPDSTTPDSTTPDSTTPEANVPDSTTQDPGAGTASTASGEASSATWDRIAECESSGDWSADTSNGYAGGLQFDPATWVAFGGRGSPEQASRDEQIAVAEKVRAEQGWRAWPACSTKLGLR